MTRFPPTFHEGEVVFQRAMGVEKRMELRGRQVVRSYMPDQHREFFCSLPFINLGVVDKHGRPWAILRTGEPGFISSLDDTSLEIRSRPLPGEPHDLELGPGAKVGVVGVQLATRRRNRMNGTASISPDGALILSVDQSFGNCAQYIQKRADADSVEPLRGNGQASVGTSDGLNDDDIALITRSDTLFIASRVAEFREDPRAGLDVNHRGGRPGFVAIADDGALLIPDYKGNNFYNTLGNILLDGRAGLQFVDFATASTLSMTGHAELLVADAYPHATDRVLHTTWFRPAQIIRGKGVLPFRFNLDEYWPDLPEL